MSVAWEMMNASRMVSTFNYIININLLVLFHNYSIYIFGAYRLTKKQLGQLEFGNFTMEN